MTTTNLKGIITWLKSWFYDKAEVDNDNVEYLETTHGSTATGSWTATSTKITELKKGTKIFLKLSSNGSGNATLNLTLANGTKTGAKNIRWVGDSNLTTHYTAGNTIGLIYDGTVWRVVSPASYGVNSWNANEYGTVQFQAGEALASRVLCGAKSDGKYYKLTANMVLNTAYPIIGTNGAIAKDAISNNMYMPRYDEIITNTKSMNLTNGKPVYIEGTSFSKGLFTISSNIITQTLTTGRYYWLLGFACSETQVRTNVYENIFYYDGTNLKSVSEPLSHSHGSLANGGTLNSDISSVNKIAVTDSSNNLKTISKVPFANLNIAKTDITSLGIPASDTNTTYSADNSTLQLSSTTFSVKDRGVTNAKIADSTIEYKKLSEIVSNGGSNTKGYAKCLQIVISANYQNVPFTFDIYQRGSKEASHVSVMFTNMKSTDPTLSSITYTGQQRNIYIYKESTSTWSIIVQKSEANDKIHIRNLQTGNNYAGNSVKFSGLNTLLTTLPTSDITQATYKDFTVDEKTKLAGIATGANKITKTSELINDVGFLTMPDVEYVSELPDISLNTPQRLYLLESGGRYYGLYYPSIESNEGALGSYTGKWICLGEGSGDSSVYSVASDVADILEDINTNYERYS